MPSCFAGHRQRAGESARQIHTQKDRPFGRPLSYLPAGTKLGARTNRGVEALHEAALAPCRVVRVQDALADGDV